MFYSTIINNYNVFIIPLYTMFYHTFIDKLVLFKVRYKTLVGHEDFGIVPKASVLLCLLVQDT